MPVAVNLVKHELRVTGVDASPTMIALCGSRMPEQEWIVSDMRAIALGRRFDGILGWDSFFFLTDDDQRSMFKVFAAHAAPSALLMFNTGPRHGEAMGEYRGEPLYHASLDATEYETLLAQSGFDVVTHVVEDAKAGGRTVWFARSRSRRPD
jgi:trans-aconitate methyltransferase